MPDRNPPVAGEPDRQLDEIGAALAREQRLNEIARALASTLDLASVMPDVVRLAAEVAGAEAGLIGLIEPDGQSIGYPYHYNFSQVADLPPSPRGRGMAWQAVETGAAVLLADYAAHPTAQPDWIRAGVCGCLTVPITAGESRIGALGLFTLSPGVRFVERDLRLAESVAEHIGAAMRNARLFAEARQRTAELETLAAVSAALRVAATRAEMLPIILDQALAALEAQSAALALRDPASGGLVIQHGRGGGLDWRTGRVSIRQSSTGRIRNPGGSGRV